MPWLAAAATPAASFVLVEVVEGSSSSGFDLFAVGVPLQAVIGLAVLAIVRSLFAVLVLVAERIAGALRRPRPRGSRRAARPIVHIPVRRVAPMASNAALRAPPVRRP